MNGLYEWLLYFALGELVIGTVMVLYAVRTQQIGYAKTWTREARDWYIGVLVFFMCAGLGTLGNLAIVSGIL